MAKKDGMGPRKIGGFTGSGSVMDNSNKKQHDAKPMGHGAALSKASSYANKGSDPAPMGSNASHKGHGKAMMAARRMSGGAAASTGADPMGEDENRLMSGKSASSRAIGSGGGKPAGVGVKASGYRLTSSAKPAAKAKKPKGKW